MFHGGWDQKVRWGTTWKSSDIFSIQLFIYLIKVRCITKTVWTFIITFCLHLIRSLILLIMPWRTWNTVATWKGNIKHQYSFNTETFTVRKRIWRMKNSIIYFLWPSIMQTFKGWYYFDLMKVNKSRECCRRINSQVNECSRNTWCMHALKLQISLVTWYGHPSRYITLVTSLSPSLSHAHIFVSNGQNSSKLKPCFIWKEAPSLVSSSFIFGLEEWLNDWRSDWKIDWKNYPSLPSSSKKWQGSGWKKILKRRHLGHYWSFVCCSPLEMKPVKSFLLITNSLFTSISISFHSNVILWWLSSGKQTLKSPPWRLVICLESAGVHYLWLVWFSSSEDFKIIKLEIMSFSRLSIHQPDRRSTYLSINPPIRPSIRPSVRPSFHPSIHPKASIAKFSTEFKFNNVITILFTFICNLIIIFHILKLHMLPGFTEAHHIHHVNASIRSSSFLP